MPKFQGGTTKAGRETTRHGGEETLGASQHRPRRTITAIEKGAHVATRHARPFLKMGGAHAAAKSDRRRDDSGSNEQYHFKAWQTRKYLIRQRNPVTIETIRKPAEGMQHPPRHHARICSSL